MKKIVFISEKYPHKLHMLTASLNMDGELMFDDEEIYPTDGSEVDDYLIVRTEHKNHVAALMGQAFNRISDTCGETADDRLFHSLNCMAGSGHWKALDEIEKWLMDRDVPFAKQKVIY